MPKRKNILILKGWLIYLGSKSNMASKYQTNFTGQKSYEVELVCIPKNNNEFSDVWEKTAEYFARNGRFIENGKREDNTRFKVFYYSGASIDLTEVESRQGKFVSLEIISDYCIESIVKRVKKDFPKFEEV
ncbi:MAG: hypothetical protein OQK82_03765 [Candidatus Pacearchaeota archaeon]|nr:hypothetical protein [Candidatus Pacearchaeota archaeon]